MAFKKILCPVDFSGSSTTAMRVAVRLANAAGAELVLAHVWFLPPLALGAGVEFPADVVQGMIDDDERGLADAVREAKRLGAQRVSSVLLTGVPWQRLVDTLQADTAFDLVVMGTHGRTGLSRMLVGSVAEQVVRHAPCSVLAVRGTDDSAVFRHVLCPVDFSDGARVALTTAGRVASLDGLGITLVHVVELPVSYAGELADPKLVEALDRDGARALTTWAAELRAKVSVPVATRSRAGKPATQVLAALDGDPTFDLIVVGSYGRTGLRRMVLGSVAETLVRHARCSVLVARARKP